MKDVKGSNWVNNNVNTVSLGRTDWPMQSSVFKMGAILAFYQCVKTRSKQGSFANPLCQLPKMVKVARFFFFYLNNAQDCA